MLGMRGSEQVQQPPLATVQCILALGVVTADCVTQRSPISSFPMLCRLLMQGLSTYGNTAPLQNPLSPRRLQSQSALFAQRNSPKAASHRAGSWPAQLSLQEPPTAAKDELHRGLSLSALSRDLRTSLLSGPAAAQGGPS